MKRWIRVCSLFCVLVLLLTPMFSTPISADKVTDKKNELAELKKEQAQLKAEIGKLGDSIEEQEKKVDNLKAQVVNLGKQIDGYRKYIEDLDQKIADQEARIEVLSGEIAAKEEELKGIMEKLKKRLAALSKNGMLDDMLDSSNKGADSLDLLPLFLSAESYEDYLVISKIIESVLEHDKKLIEKAEQEKAEIEVARLEEETAKAALEQDKKDAQSAQAELEAQYTNYDNLYTEARNAEIALQKKKGEYEKELAKIKKAEEDLDREIEELLAAALMPGKYGGKMYWPAPALTTISSPFGNRSMGWHGGVDLWCSGCLGKPIYAAADGVVLKAQTNHYSYGNFVMIDHGVDDRGIRIVTLYAHMRYAPLVSNNQKVVGGTTQLGVVGNTGNSYGAHLHFEVRENNTRVDPIGKGYIKKPK